MTSEAISKYLRILGDPLKFQIITILSKRPPTSVEELTSLLRAQDKPIARTTVSHALSILEQLGLVHRSTGRVHECTVDTFKVGEVLLTAQSLFLGFHRFHEANQNESTAQTL